MRRSFSPLVAFATCVALIATVESCVKGPTDATLPALIPTDSNIAGSFDLVAVNGLPLPSTQQVNATQAVEVLAERIVVASNRTWADTSTTVIIDLTTGTTSATSRTSSAGTLGIANGTIQFVTTLGGGSAFTGSVHQDTLTVLFGGTRFVYVR